MEKFFADAELMDSPLRALKDFIASEKRCKIAKKYEDMRFVGYVLDIGFDSATVITSDPYKIAVGGVPRGSFLVMVPDNLDSVVPHFTLLRVMDTAPTPLSKDVQQTYFELHKKSMPELDVWTKGELQWGAFKSKVLGMFYPDPQDALRLSFSGDVNNVVSAHRYKVYSPDEDLLKLIVNGTVKKRNVFPIGQLRPTECSLPFSKKSSPFVAVNVSVDDFKGFRTAMFGKTRLGKSNVVKIIARSVIETTKEDKSVGQLIFDINGEYANDNEQDECLSLRGAYPEQCFVYALTKRDSTPSKPLRLNFYQSPESCLPIIRSLLEQSGKKSQYIESFASVQLPSVEDVSKIADSGQRNRAVRKIQMYWAILNKAGFKTDEKSLKKLNLRGDGKYAPRHFDPHFNKEILEAVYGKGNCPQAPETLEQLVSHLEDVAAFRNKSKDNKVLQSKSKPIFDADDVAMLEFLSPVIGGGVKVLRPYMHMHDPHAKDFVNDILNLLDDGKTVILDLGNATQAVRSYFSDMLSEKLFAHQEEKFTRNDFAGHYVQLYFEEAHNLFPKDDKDFTGVYTRFAKEGAKFHIGMVYSTQSPSTINKELLAQTENFFVAHMSSRHEVDALARLQIQYEGLQHEILHTRTPGYMRMMTFSHRFVVPVQIEKFEVVAPRAEG